MGYMFDQLKSKQFEAFFSQDVENGHFDVIFQIGDEKLYAHKFMLGISNPFVAMFSERWSNKDESINIESYSYNDFKEFLNVFYHSKPKLTDDNIFTMVDMAEFYDVSEMKMLCDEFLEKMEITPENVFQMCEFSHNYSALSKFQSTVNSFMIENLSSLLKYYGFVDIKKEMLKLIISFKRSESQEEELFEAVYKWGEHQAIVKHGSAENEYFVLNHAIKEELTEIIPKICFEHMNLDFVVKFVVPKGFLFSYQEMSEILQKAKSGRIHVTVVSPNGKTLTGKLSCDSSLLSDIYDTITSMKDSKSVVSQQDFYSKLYPFANYQYWSTNKPRPSKPNQLNKNNKVKYYLIFDAGDNLALKRTSQLIEDDYLLAELDGDIGFC